MRRTHVYLWYIGSIASGCGDDANPIGEALGSGSTSSSDVTDSGPAETSGASNTGSGDVTTGGVDSSSSSSGPASACGDGIIEGDEVCDTTALADETCMSRGFDGGDLACNARCDDYDTRSCWSAVCGDGLAEGSELCDGSDIAGASCVSEGFDSGDLGCNANCTTYDTSDCGTCGNVIVDGDEVCDDIVLLGQTCTSLGFDGGSLGCNPDCLTYDASGCGVCGNDLVDGAESCDGMNLGGQTCPTQGFDGGDLGCNLDCLGFDTSGCGSCGNDLVDGVEICDGADTGDQTCPTQGFDSGNLGCDLDCMAFDTSSCGTCGNGIVDGSEDCDGPNLVGQTCESLGGLGGTLACAPDCQLDLAACEMPIAPTLLLTQGATLQERELDGTLLSSTLVPLLPGAESELREPTHGNGVTYLYRGTFSPTMTHYDVGIGDWVHESFPGWSTVNNVSYGGLAYTEDWIWATDMTTAGAPEMGLVRFSLLGLPTERVMDTEEYIDVFAGLDGLVYGLQYNEQTLDVFEPGAGLQVSTVPLAMDVRAIAVAADGTILGASWDGSIYLFDDLGGLLMSLGAGVGSLVDVDLASNGTIAVGGRFGHVVIVDPGLAGIAGSFDLGDDETFLELLEWP